MLRNTWAIWILIINTLVLVIINPIVGVDIEKYYNPAVLEGKIYLLLQLLAHLILFVFIYKQVKLIRAKYYYLNKYQQVVGKNIETGDVLYAAISWSTNKVYKLIKPVDTRVAKNLQQQREQTVKKHERAYENFYQDIKTLIATLKKLHQSSLALKVQFEQAINTDIDWLNDNIQLSKNVYQQILDLRQQLLKFEGHHVFQVPVDFKKFESKLFEFPEDDKKIMINMFDVEKIDTMVTAVMDFKQEIDEVHKAITIYIGKINEAEQENDKINENKQYIGSQSVKLLKNLKLINKLSQQDKDSLKLLVTQTSEQQTPREMRQMQYLFDQIKKN